MTPKKASVLLLDGQSVFARPVGLCLGQSPELTLHVLSLDRYTPLRFSRYVKSFTVYAQGELMKAIEEFCAKTEVDVLFPVDEVATQFLSTHGTRFPDAMARHPVPTLDLLQLGLDKWALAEYLDAAKIPHPLTVLAASLEERLRDFRSDLPVMLKPRVGGGGRGIQLFAGPAAASAFLAKRAVDHTAYIVQEFMHGYDIDCSVLCRRGEILAFTIQRPVVTSHMSFQPAGLIELLHDEKVLAVIRQLITATQWDGIAHIDCRFDERDAKIKIVEINPRYWGSIYGSLCAGVNFPVLACQAARGVAFPLPDYADVGYASGGSSVKAWTRRLDKTPFTSPSRTAWRYLASDPIPEVVQASLTVAQRLKQLG